MVKKGKKSHNPIDKESTSFSQNLEVLNYQLPAKSIKKKVWDIVNSSVFIWFLSSVVVVAVSNFYNSNKAKNQLETKRLEIIEKLNSEISYRVFYAVRFLETQKINISLNNNLQNVYNDVYLILDNYDYNSTDVGHNYSLHIEYFRKPFASLIFELKNVDSTSVKNVENAFDGFSRIEDFTSLKEYAQHTREESIEKSLQIIRSKILNPKWESYFIINPFKTKI